ncbi:hypothetical protein C0Q70_06132 [Pomacea canaliculata]|uniref:SCP domain-containing protein n=1 Tax=Pomacea canaliculata TaxID=400727 RepID=A0A2T7PN58_POMCA|nr:hypothetical protein C0Q70_06132 [Pomacea canaliculata]
MLGNLLIGQKGWDAELEEWAKWVISCNANYPGPQHSFTNFYRFGSEMSVKDVVSAWRQEGRQPFLERGCRTPLDRTRCNRNTNMMQPRLTSMACAALQCSSMRQLVCIYDNIGDRV